MRFETVVVGSLETNCYLVYCSKTKECVVIDPGADAEKIFRAIAESELKPVLLVNTHGHVDHIGANGDIKDRLNIPLCIHKSDSAMLESILQSALGLLLGARQSPPPDRFLEDGDVIEFGARRLDVIHTPGHSEGSISLKGDGLLISGDTLFCGGVGRTDLPGGSWEKLVDSIQKKILTLPEETIVLPGHGPSTTVGQEKNDNPFIQ